MPSFVKIHFFREIALQLDLVDYTRFSFVLQPDYIYILTFEVSGMKDWHVAVLLKV